MRKAKRDTGWALLFLFLAGCGGDSPPGLSDVATWRARLAKGDPAAVKTLRDQGAAATDLLAALLADEDVTVVSGAGLVAEGLGAESGPLGPALLDAVVRFPGDPRMLAPLRTRTAKPVLASYLLDVLESGTPPRQAAALEVLTHYGELAAPGVAALVRFLDDGDETARMNAMNALSGIGAEARSAVPALEAARERAGSDHERRTAAAAIQHIQAKAAAGR